MSKKNMLGFQKGYITIFKGDQERYTDFFKESVCRYHGIFGWYLVSNDTLDELPVGIEPVKLPYDKVFKDDDTLLPQKEIIYNVESLLYGENKSEYWGVVGSRYDLVLKCVYAKTSDGAYGAQTFHLFEDKDGNIFSWSTAAKVLEVGKIYECRATVKQHSLYHSQKQTVLTRAMCFEEREDF